jgi:hypothetical protein
VEFPENLSEAVDLFRKQLWGQMTPHSATLKVKGFDVQVWLVAIGMTHRRHQYSCLLYIPGLKEFVIAAHFMEDLNHLYAQISADIDVKKKPRCTDAASSTLCLQLLRPGQASVPLKEFPQALRSSGKNPTMEDLKNAYTELLQFSESDVFKSLQCKGVPLQVLEEMQRFPMHAMDERRLFRTNPKNGENWYNCFFLCLYKFLLFFFFVIVSAGSKLQVDACICAPLVDLLSTKISTEKYSLEESIRLIAVSMPSTVAVDKKQFTNLIQYMENGGRTQPLL